MGSRQLHYEPSRPGIAQSQRLPRSSHRGRKLGSVAIQDFIEEIQVLGRDLVGRVKALIHEGNVRRIIVKDEHGNTFVEIPVTVAAVGTILAPVLAALGAISALVAKFKIVVIRVDPQRTETAEK
jgi:hypothetical protein